MIRYCSILAAAASASAAISPAAAQGQSSITIEAATDEVRRGLSWTEGRAAASAEAFTQQGPIAASARVVNLRGSTRHDGAWAVADLVLSTERDVGPLQVRAAATAHLFAGAGSKMDYVELGGSASYMYGPVLLTGGVELAPGQDAIGGSNLHLYANVDAGIPGTPFTVMAGIGHSSGSADGSARTQRLRPGGDYTNWRLGVEHRKGAVALGLDYLGTDVQRADAVGPFADVGHVGNRVIGRVRLSF